MSLAIDAVVAGHICLDICPDLNSMERVAFEKAFLPGRLIAAGPAAFSTGGAVSNTGLAMNRLGIPVRLSAKIGADLFGQAILHILAAQGPRLADGIIVDPSASTSYTILINYPGVDRIFLHSPGANDIYSAGDVPYADLEQARLFHFGYPPIMRSMYLRDGDSLVSMFQRSKNTGVTTSLDMAFPDPSSPAGKVDWRRLLSRTLPWVDFFFPSVEEILFMLRRETYERMSAAGGGTGGILAQVTPELLSSLGKELLGMGARVVVLKLGERGLYLRTGAQSEIDGLGKAYPIHLEAWSQCEYWAPCFAARVAGTTGAGDATIAGLLSAVLRGFSPQAALTAAVAVGACCVEAADALSGIRTWDATMERIQGGWQRQPLTLRASGWQLDQASGVWRGPCS